MRRTAPGATGLIAGVLLGFLGASASAQEERPKKDFGDISVQYEFAASWKEEQDTLWLFWGNVELAAGVQAVRADRILAWTRLDDKDRKLREMYVEGNVVFRGEDPKTKRPSSIRAQRLFYDFVKGQGFVLDLSAKTDDGRVGTPVIVRAREARQAVRGQWVARDVVVTTCTYGIPHYHVRLDKATIVGEEPVPDASPYDLWPFKKWSVRGEGLGVEIFGVPIFFWPVLAIGSSVSELPIKAARGGRTSRFGTWVETDWGVSIRKGVVDALNPWDGSAAADDRDKWGELNWEFDWRQRRGLAAGIDLEWKWGDYHGYIDSYYLHDRGGDEDIVFDLQFLPLERPERGRLRAFHRHEVAPDWRFETEISYVSDRSLLPEFFEKEFKEDKEPESALYLRWRHDSWAGYLLERHRLNDFQTQNEYRPRGRLSAFALSLPYGFTYSGHLEVVNMRAAFDEDLGLDRQELQRLDLINEVARPVDLQVATLAPFLRIRHGAFHEDLEDEDEYRFVGTAGVRLTSQMHRVHDVGWEGVGLRKLRHIASLEARYTGNFENTLDPAELYPFDEVDRIDRFDEIAFEMRHRFQTKVQSGDHLVAHEFLDVGLAVEYYPDSERDTTALNVNNHLQPFHWVTLKPSDAVGTLKERDWSNLHWDAAFRPRNLFSVTVSGEYNPEDAQEEVRQYSVAVQPSAEFRASAGEVFVRDITTAFTASLKWQVTEKWGIEADVQYDFEQDEYINRRLVVNRDFHDFMLETVWEEDEGRDERKFYVTVYPKFARKKR